MKYGIKKLTAILMAILMVLNMAPVSVFAAPGDGVPSEGGGLGAG